MPALRIPIFDTLSNEVEDVTPCHLSMPLPVPAKIPKLEPKWEPSSPVPPTPPAIPYVYPFPRPSRVKPKVRCKVLPLQTPPPQTQPVIAPQSNALLPLPQALQVPPPRPPILPAVCGPEQLPRPKCLSCAWQVVNNQGPPLVCNTCLVLTKSFSFGLPDPNYHYYQLTLLPPPKGQYITGTPQSLTFVSHPNLALNPTTT